MCVSVSNIYIYIYRERERERQRQRQRQRERDNCYNKCKHSKNKGTSPLRTVVPSLSNQTQTIEFSLESEKILQVQF